MIVGQAGMSVSATRYVLAIVVGAVIGLYATARITIIDSNLGYVPASQLELQMPGLFSSALGTATLGDLPDGTVMQAGSVHIGNDDLTMMTRNSSGFNPLFNSWSPSLLETTAVSKMVNDEARFWANQNGIDSHAPANLLQMAYFQHLFSTIHVNGLEILKAMHPSAENYDTSIGDRLISANTQIYKRKRDKFLNEYFHLLGQNHNAVVSRQWAQDKYQYIINKPAIKAIDDCRRSKKPTVVFFTDYEGQYKAVWRTVLFLRQFFGNKVNVVYTVYSSDAAILYRYGIVHRKTAVIYNPKGSEFVRFSHYTTMQVINAVRAAAASR